MSHALKKGGLGTQVQQKKSCLSHKHILTCLRFAEGMKVGPMMIGNVWLLVIKVYKFNSYGRSWSWIGDGEHVGPQHVHQIVKHGVGLVMI